MTFESLINSEQFKERLFKAENISEVKELFLDEGVTISEEELLTKLLPTGDDLSEEDLEIVSGGGSVMGWLRSYLGGGAGAFGGGGKAGGR